MGGSVLLGGLSDITIEVRGGDFCRSNLLSCYVWLILEMKDGETSERNYCSEYDGG